MDPFPPAPTERETVDLVTRAQAGDQGAWRRLYERHHDELLFAIRQGLGPRLRASLESEDVLQSALLEAVKALPRFTDRGEGGLRAFLHRLALNKIRDRADTYGARKRSGGVPLTDTMADAIPDAASPPTYHDAPRFERLERALQKLPPEMREIILLRRVEGLSSKEAAGRLGRNDAAARKLFSRAIAKLALLVDEEPGP